MQTVKMVITGPFNSGKTEFIQTVSEIDVVATEKKISSESERIKETTTVAMDFGRITVDEELVLYLFGTPGQKRFDFMWEILSEGMLGFIVMVDSTRPETFREARSILETFRLYAPTPYVVAATTYLDEFQGPVRRMETSAKDLTDDARNFSLMILAGTLVLVALIVWVYSHRLTGKIKSLTEVTERISVGDLAAEVETKSKDEIGELAEAVSRMQESIRLSIERLRRRK